MTEGIVLTRLEMTCSACPSQWDAYDEHGNYYYIRYRHGFLSVTKGDVCGEPLLETICSDDDDGVMSTEEMLEHTGMVMA